MHKITNLNYLPMKTLEKSSKMLNLITPREKNILILIVNGHTNKEIAEIYRISIRTVEAHKQNLFRKFGVDNVVKMVRLALEHDLVK